MTSLCLPFCQFRDPYPVPGCECRLDLFLAAEVVPPVEAAHRKALDRPDRQRAIGGGDDFDLSTTDQVLVAALRLRRYQTNEIPGFLFGVSTWAWCEASAREIFGAAPPAQTPPPPAPGDPLTFTIVESEPAASRAEQSDPIPAAAAKALAVIVAKPGIQRSALLKPTKLKARELSAALGWLEASGKASRGESRTGGRTAECWFPEPQAEQQTNTTHQPDEKEASPSPDFLPFLQSPGKEVGREEAGEKRNANLLPLSEGKEGRPGREVSGSEAISGEDFLTALLPFPSSGKEGQEVREGRKGSERPGTEGSCRQSGGGVCCTALPRRSKDWGIALRRSPDPEWERKCAEDRARRERERLERCGGPELSDAEFRAMMEAM